MANRTVTYRLQAEIGSFQAKMAQASAASKKLADDLTSSEKSAVQARQGLDTFGSAAGRAAVVAGAGVLAVTKAAMDWESAFAGVEKTVDGTTAQLGALEGQLREMARTMPATHDEIAAVAQAAGALGVATPDVADFTRTMIMLGEATDDLTADQAATAIAQMTNVMQTAPEDVDNLAAALVALGNNGASTEGQILFMAQSIAGAGAQLGIAEADILAIANATASMGIEVEAGGTAISTVLSKMASAAKMGGSQLDAFASTAGLSADEFARLVENDPTQAFVSLTQGLNRVNESGGNVFAILKSLGLSDVRVSRAMLSISSAGDTLTESLENGRTAWEQNTALTDEYGKRAETTASQVKVSWNNIKDAAIDAGAALLPVVEGVASTVATLANAFQSLPGPVKGMVGPLLAVTAILGSGVWAGSKIISGIAGARQAFADLGISAQRSKTDIDGVGTSADRTRGKLGRIAGAAGGILAVTSVASGLADSLDRINSSDVDRNLTALGKGVRTDDIDQVVKSLREVNSARNAIDIGTPLTAVLTLGMGTSTMGKYKDNIEQIDQALAGMVESGRRAEAIDIYNKLEADSKKAGVSADEVKESFNAYGLALRNTKDDSDSAADAANSQASATEGLAAATQESAAASEEAAQAYAQQVEASTGVAEQFANISDGLNDSQVSLGDWIAKMQESAAALRDFRVNAVRAGERGLRAGLIKELQAAGPEGAMRMRQLANASQREIQRANRAWSAGRREIANYVAATTEVPDEIKTEATLEIRQAQARERELVGMLQRLGKMRPSPEVRARTERAQADLARVRAYLASLQDKTITVTTFTREVGAVGATGVGAQTVRRRAAGGPIWGEGTATSDSIPVLASNGEYMQTAAAHGYYGTAFMDAINQMAIPRDAIQRLAQGGAVTAGLTAPSLSAHSSAPRINVAAPNVNVGGARFILQIDGREVEAIVREVNDADARFAAGAGVNR